MMTGSTISHYRILEELGRGGMGVVYKAQDTKLDRTVALKFLPHHLTANEAEKARFLQEARAASSLNHPNVCTIYGIEEHEGQQFIEMEYVEGVTLRQKFERAPLRMDEAMTCAIQIGEALQEAHAKGIVHRDIKADNIMVNDRNQVKVMDFGLAKLKGSLKLTKTSSTVGTLAYMAPEQIQGGEVDARSDIFSFGVVLFEMLTGKLPFRGEHEAAMMYSILNEEPESLQKFVSDPPSELLHILNTALEKNPGDRYQSASEMVRDLRRVKKQSSRVSRTSQVMYVPEIPSPSESRSPVFAGSRRWIWTGVGVLVIGAVAAFLLLSRRGMELNPAMKFRTLQIPFASIQYPGLSADGNWVAFGASDGSGKWDIYYMNTSVGDPRRVTEDSSSTIGMCDISPDAGQIVYSRDNPRTNRKDIMLVSALGGTGKKIAEGDHAHWRPDGQRIVYARLSGGLFGGSASSKSGKFEVWTVKPDGSDNRLEFIDSVSVRGRYSLSWSPDGRSVAWLRSFPGGYEEVMRRDLETQKEQQVTFYKAPIDELSWAPTDHIVFSSGRGGNTNLWMIPASGGESVQITKGSGPDIGMRISRDGKRLLYLQRQTIGYVFAAKADGAGAEQLTFDERNILAPTFSPNGKQIAFCMSDPDPLKYQQNVYLMDRNGSNRRQLTSGDEVAESPFWSPDGRSIGYASRAVSDPRDSAAIHVVDAVTPGVPRRITRGFYGYWVSPDTLYVYSLLPPRTYLVNLAQNSATPLSDDSLFIIPTHRLKHSLYADLHGSHLGWWVTQVKGTDTSKSPAKRILSQVPAPNLSPGGRFFYYSPASGQLARISLPDGNEEKIRGSFPGLRGDFSISRDGREITYVNSRPSSKLVMIEDLFK